MKISRNDIYIKSETGGSWFDEFLRICKDQEQLLEKIVSNKSESVASVVEQYREATGMDLVKNASVSKIKKISIRQPDTVISPEIKEIIDSFCMNSGGTKNAHSIINYLRNKFGNDMIKFSDEYLTNYIDERKKYYKDNHVKDEFSANDVGRVGTEVQDNYDDQIADYYSHGKF